MLSLRWPAHSGALWEKIASINQVDTEERNQRMSLIFFIYNRPTKVVAKTSNKHYFATPGVFRPCRRSEEQSEHGIWQRMTRKGGKLRYLSQPSHRTMILIAESTC
ncbi:hypothetical protein GGR56DRAFT_660651 [Xylariaceae sp. FL0804]|nr:hypothetical protein GGR56DRAFT_660651 [Xylariaceae sp. FL0804]